MIFNKRLVLLSILIIIIVQILLHTNNKQKTSFRYFKWTLQEVSIGKLINISFFSGLFINLILNSKITNNKINTFENKKENYEPKNEEDKKSNIKMPPQRDIRETQPTISVNYRVVKNMNDNNFKKDRNYSNSPDNNDGWDNEDLEW